MKLQRTKFLVHVESKGLIINAYRLLLRKDEWLKIVGRRGITLEDNSKMDFKLKVSRV
jgi:hypothetical protein